VKGKGIWKETIFPKEGIKGEERMFKEEEFLMMGVSRCRILLRIN